MIDCGTFWQEPSSLDESATHENPGLSDLHIEFAHFVPDPAAVEAADVVVLTGHIGVGSAAIPWARKTFAGKPIIYIASIREFYRHHWTKLLPELRDQAASHEVHFWETDSITFGGVRFLGTTLWAGFLLFGKHKKPMAIRVLAAVRKRTKMAVKRIFWTVGWKVDLFFRANESISPC